MSDQDESQREQLEALNPKSLAPPNGNGHEEFPKRAKEQFVLEKDAKADHGDSDSTRCGIGCFKPSWIQMFATKRAFMLVFSVLAVIQGMSWAYFTATITTLEKRFKISSQTAGKPKRLYERNPQSNEAEIQLCIKLLRYMPSTLL
jgi:hypothetical protein